MNGSRQDVKKRCAWLVAKLILATVLLGWLYYDGRFDPRAYIAIPRHGNVHLLLAIMGAQTVRVSLHSLRWWVLLRAQEIPLSYVQVTAICARGFFSNLVVPGGLGLDALRAHYLHRHARGQWTAAMSSLVLDRVLGVVSVFLLGTVCTVSLLQQRYDLSLAKIVEINALVAAVATVGLLCCVRLARRWTSKHRDQWRVIADGRDALRRYRTHMGAVALAFALALAGHFMVSAAAYFAFLALAEPARYLDVLAVTPIVTMAQAIPLTPLGLGVTDATAAVLFPRVGLQLGAEANMLTRFTSSLVLFLCGTAYLVDPFKHLTQPLADRAASHFGVHTNG